jgi:hypothetical protein
MRYEFDRLGWFHFEWLVQTCLKAEFGFTVESWGGHRDLGRDAYSSSTIEGLLTTTTLHGPVVFQAKFVAEANARGSDKNPLFSACRAEALAIKKRVQQQLWREPRTYVLITNCPVTQGDRDGVAEILNGETSARVLVFGEMTFQQF